jgi:hypothetical protein
VIRIKRSPVESRQVRRSTKRRADRITTFLRRLINPFDFGVKTKGAAPHPVHANTKHTILNAFATNYWGRMDRMSDRFFGDHFMGKTTGYFTGNGRASDPETIVMIDIDCHKTGTLTGAIEFAQHLRDKCFPNLYWETSTNGNGLHAYVIVHKQGCGDVFLNQCLDRFERFLVSVLESESFEVEMVEVKGQCPVIVWGERKGQIEKLTMGRLAKLPRDAHRFEELKTTTRLTCHDLLKLPVPENRKQKKGKRPPASVSGCFLSEEEAAKTKTSYLRLAEVLLDNHRLQTSTNSVVEAEDVAVFVMFLKFFTEHMNADGSLPYARFKKFWEAVAHTGDVARSFQSNRFAAIRNYLSSLGLIEWEDNTFTPGQMCADGKRRGGKACKWKASEALLQMMEMADVAENAELLPVAEKDSAAAKDPSRERASLAKGDLHTRIRNLSRASYNDTIRPIQQVDPPPYLLSPDDISKFIEPFKATYGVAV